jgi:hypothetical protein
LPLFLLGRWQKQVNFSEILTGVLAHGHFDIERFSLSLAQCLQALVLGEGHAKHGAVRERESVDWVPIMDAYV